MTNISTPTITLLERYSGERLSDYVYRTLFQNIMDLTLKPGQVINDIRLAEEIGCSRTPVREALSKLHEDFLVDIYPQSGIFITPIDFNIIDEMQFMRVSINVSIVKKLCQSIKTEYIDKLTENLLLQEHTVQRSDDFKRFFSLDKQFHSLCYDAVNFPLIQQLMKKTVTHIDRLTYFLALEGLPYMERSYREHKIILDSILTHNDLEATHILEKHMLEYKNIKIPANYSDYFRNFK